MKVKLGYIVKCKSELIELLKSTNNDLHEYFSDNYILVTEEHEYEAVFEGWKMSIRKSAKNTFITETVMNLDFSSPELESIFGSFNSNIELFDKWWILEDADCETIPTTWLST